MAKRAASSDLPQRRRKASPAVKAAADRAEARRDGKPVDAKPKPAVLSPPESRPKPKGRKTKYMPELGELICNYLADGQTLIAVCRRDDIPVAESTVRRWATDTDHPFAAKYARARELGYLRMADEILEDAGAAAIDPGSVARDRLKVETKKWLLAKALPKLYGDKVDVGLSADSAFVQLLQAMSPKNAEAPA